MYISKGGNITSPKFVNFSMSSDANDNKIVINEANTYKRRYYDLVKGQILFGPFDFAWRFSEGYAIAQKGQKIGILDSIGNFTVIPNSKAMKCQSTGFTHEGISDLYMFNGGFCPMLASNGAYGLINNNGEWIVKPVFSRISEVFDDNFRVVTIFSNGVSSNGIIDKKGNYIIKPIKGQNIDYYSEKNILMINQEWISINTFKQRYLKK